MIGRGADGLPGRICGPWTREKLAYLQKYATAFTQAMKGKWSPLVYMDFLAGPGIGIERGSHVEFPGSPLVALGVKPAFDQLFFSDTDPDNVAALRRRIPPPYRARTFVEVGDCHVVAAKIIAQLPASALALAFVDPEGFEVTFKMFEILAKKRVDVLYLFPGGIGVARNVGNFVRQAKAPLDDLMPGWRKLKRARLAAGERLTKEEMAARDQPFVLEFLARMQGLGFQFSDRGEPYFTNQKNVKMYHLLFFSQHPTALSLWRKVTRIEASGQRRLPL